MLKMFKIVDRTSSWLKTFWPLILILLYALLIRLPYPMTGHFAFMFDHGKDSLNALDMLWNFSPRLIGPWTSIPGLFFGPAWYYFLAFWFLVGNFHPAAPVLGMIVLLLIQIVLVYRHFGRVAACTIASTPLWIAISTSAWNPYPLTLISWLLLILLQKTSRTRQLSLWQAFWFGAIASLGFHFSSAYAVFYPVIILGCWIYQRLRLTWQKILLTAVGFIVPFLPQLLFEIRYHWLETQAIINYFTVGGEIGDTLSGQKIFKILGTTLGEFRLAVLPQSPWLTNWFTVIFGLLLVYFGWQIWRHQTVTAKKNSRLINCRINFIYYYPVGRFLFFTLQ